MFDLGWPELMLIMVVALIVIGPKELPNAIRTVMGIVRKLRGAAREFQSGLDDIARESGLDDVKRDLRDMDYLDPAKALGELTDSEKDPLGLDDDPIEMNSILDDVNREPPKTAEADAEAILAATPEETADEDTSTDDADLDKAAAPTTSGEVSS
jgi:sec-independent protein translocase protein TatB